jgi:hypothetical protein
MTPSRLEGCYDIERHDTTEMARPLQIAKQEALTDSIHFYNSEPLHDHISTVGCYTDRARSRGMMSHPARPCNQPPDHLHIGQSTADEHELVRPALNTDSFNKEDRQQKQQEKDNSDNENDSQLLQEANNVAAALKAEKVMDIHIPSKEDSSPGLANSDLSPEPSQDR